MAPAIVHFLVGASLALLLVTPIALRYDLSPEWPLWLVVVGGLWGLIPDVHHIAPVYQAELYSFHNSPWVDLFAFHYTLDRPFVRARYTASVLGSILCFLGAVSVFTIATQLRTRTAVEETRVPHLVALAIVVLPVLVLVAAVGGGLSAIVAWVGEQVGS